MAPTGESTPFLGNALPAEIHCPKPRSSGRAGPVRVCSASRRRILEVMKPYAGTRRHLPNSPFKPKAVPVVETFVIDERVTHDKYGLGRVVSVEGEEAVVVDFGDSRVRLFTPFDKLNKL